jgi:hypothetical protein
MEPEGERSINNEADPLAQFGLDAIDLRWTLKDTAAKRSWMINKDHLPKLVELGLVEIREDVPYLTIAGQNTVGVIAAAVVLWHHPFG